MKIKYLFPLLTFLLILFLCSCNNEQIIMSIDNNYITIGLGAEYKANIKVEGLENPEFEYSYSGDIISINNDIIKGENEGSCEVKVSLKNHPKVEALNLYIDVLQIDPEEIITSNEIDIVINETYQINLSFKPENASPTVNYKSNDEDIAKVDENGLVSAVSEGTTYIIIKSTVKGSVYTRVKINVCKPSVTEINANKHDILLNYNEEYQLEWEVKPSLADQNVYFESNDESIASVNEQGLITAHKYGETIIKIISSSNNGVYTNIHISVKGTLAESLEINEKVVNINLGEEYQIKFNILPIEAYQGLEYIYDSKDAIEINDNTLIAKKAGTYTMTLKTIDTSNLSETITINVKESENPVFYTSSDFDKLSKLNWNESFDSSLGIRAFDSNDGEISDKIIISGEVDNRSYGEYKIEYSVTNSKGKTSTFERIVKVEWGYDVTVIGHAGSYYGVPNSEEAILYAAQVLKYPAIEIDVKQSKDGVFVLSHDPVWGNANLEETNWDVLKNVEHTVTKTTGIVGANLSNEQRTYTSKICTLERFLEICKEYNIIAVIELKTSKGISNWTEANSPSQSRMPALMELIEKTGMLNRVIFLTNQELCLNWVKTHNYDYIPCQYLTLSSCENENTLEIVKKYGLDISFNVRDGIKISDEWLQKYRDAGCKLATFTFEEYASYADIQSWIDKGVDYVTTDWHELDKLDLK